MRMKASGGSFCCYKTSWLQRSYRIKIIINYSPDHAVFKQQLCDHAKKGDEEAPHVAVLVPPPPERQQRVRKAAEACSRRGGACMGA